MKNIIVQSFKQQLKQSTNRPTFRFILILQPIFNCLLLYFLLKNQSSQQIGEYLFVNVCIMNLWSAVVFSSASDLERERRMGTLGSNFATPADFRLIYLGKVFSNTFLAISSFVITFLFIRVILGLNIIFPRLDVTIFLLIVILFSFISLSITLGFLFLIYRNAIIWINVLEYPIYVLSGIAIDIKYLPSYLHPFSFILPTRWIVRLLKYSFEQQITLLDIVKSFDFWILVFLTIIYTCVFLLLNKYVTYKVMKKGNLEVY